MGIAVALFPLWFVAINLRPVVIAPGEVVTCKLWARGANVTLSDGRTLSLHADEVDPDWESKPVDQRCLAAGTRLERRRSDMGVRIDGRRPTSDWFVHAWFAYLGSWSLGFCLFGLAQRLRERDGTWSAGVVGLLFVATGVAFFGASALLRGLSRYELVGACVGIAAVGALGGMRFRVPAQ